MSLNSPLTPFLLLDLFPTPLTSRLLTIAKVVAKEGVFHGEWREVRAIFRRFGSVRIPEALVGALTELGTPFLRNDFSEFPKARTVVALKNEKCLRWALEKKKKGQIDHIIAGPFVATMPWECEEILLDPQIDRLLFLSSWHRDLFLKEAGKLSPKTSVWFAGVDTEWWKALERETRSQILIFDKQIDRALLQKTKDLITSIGKPFKVIEYGTYTTEEYRKELSKSLFAVFLHRTETQGMATFEAWSCGVPTLHFDPGVMSFLGKPYAGASSCPYLDSDTGLKFSSEKEIESAFENMVQRLPQFHPRRYVLDGFTNRDSALRFLEILSSVNEERATGKPDIPTENYATVRVPTRPNERSSTFPSLLS